MYSFIFPRENRKFDIDVSGKELTIGRDKTCDVCIKDDRASRTHAVIYLSDQDRPMIRDLESKNGTIVNSEQITEEELCPGDIVKIGESVFVFTWNPEYFRPDKQHQYYQNTLIRIDRTLLTQREYPDLIQCLMDEVFRVMQAECGYLILKKGERYKVIACRGAAVEDKETFDREVSATIIEQCFKNPSTFIISDAKADSAYASSDSVKNLNLRSVLVSPLRYGTDIIGALYLENRTHPDIFTENDRKFMDQLSEMASLSIIRSWELHEEKRKRKQLETDLFEKYSFRGIITRDPAMIKILETVVKVAPSDVNILLEGETGTGKELLALAIHENSKRHQKPFVVLSCGAFNENLLDSELFGHVKGAFTGSIKDKEGRFASANGGTLLLDEVSEMSQSLQVKLLRVLQFGEYSKVGSNGIEHTDIRCICASNKNLKELVDAKKFREDLYYRLFVLEINIPPLRDRKGDIPLLLDHFIKTFCTQKNISLKSVSPEVMDILMNYDFPGNVRELEHMVKRAIILTKDTVMEKEHLPPEILQSVQTLSLGNITTKHDLSKAKQIATKQAVSDMEEKFLSDTLTVANGNVTQAAKNAGLSRSYFQKLMRKYNYSAKNFKIRSTK